MGRELLINQDVDRLISLGNSVQIAARPEALENLPAARLNSQCAGRDRWSLKLLYDLGVNSSLPKVARQRQSGRPRAGDENGSARRHR